MLIPLLQNNQQVGSGAPVPSTTCLILMLSLNEPMVPATMVGTGGAGGPYTFSATGLPPGISLSSSGVMSGTPTLDGDFPYTVFVTDSAATQGTVHCSTSVTGLGDDGLGIIRFLDVISPAEVVSSETDGFGELVQVDGIETWEDFGIMVPYQQNLVMKIEYQRHGKQLTDLVPFEIPDRYITYIRHYVLARCLEREGPGQDLELAAHFQARWLAGVERVNRRRNAMSYQKSMVMGGSTSVRGQKPPRVRYPWNYGTVVR